MNAVVKYPGAKWSLAGGDPLDEFWPEQRQKVMLE